MLRGTREWYLYMLARLKRPSLAKVKSARGARYSQLADVLKREVEAYGSAGC